MRFSSSHAIKPFWICLRLSTICLPTLWWAHMEITLGSLKPFWKLSSSQTWPTIVSCIIVPQFFHFINHMQMRGKVSFWLFFSIRLFLLINSLLDMMLNRWKTTQGEETPDFGGPRSSSTLNLHSRVHHCIFQGRYGGIRLFSDLSPLEVYRHHSATSLPK